MIKKLIRRILSELGYEIFKTKHARFPIGSLSSYVSQICKPKTIFDVGVGYGTYPLYKAFPKAHFVLVEPLREYRDSINAIAKEYDCSIHYKAVGNGEALLEINVDKNHLTKSSLADRSTLTKTGNPLEKRTVEVTTLDTILGESPPMERPILLKIDTEGHELSALEGAKSLLQVTDIVIAEVSIAKRFDDSYEFEDILSYMSENDFYLFSFLTIAHKEGEFRPRFADIVFKRRIKET